MFLYYLFYIPIFLLAWALVFPEQAVAVVENMRRSLDAYVAAHIARREIHLLRAHFRKWGKQNGYDSSLIDEVLNEHSSELQRRIEARYSSVTIEELTSHCD
jgi:hypothetical protein